MGGTAEVMTIHLTSMADKLIVDILNRFKNLPEGSKFKATRKVQVGGLNAYKKSLRQTLGNLAAISTNMALDDVNQKEINFQDPLSAGSKPFPPNSFKKLPKATQEKILALSNDVAEAQAGDVQKAVTLQFGQSVDVTADPRILEQDMREAFEKTLTNACGRSSSTDPVGVRSPRVLPSRSAIA